MVTIKVDGHKTRFTMMKGGIILKKFMAIMLAVLMVFSMAACGGGESSGGQGGEEAKDPGKVYATKTLAYFDKYVSSGAYTSEMKSEYEGMVTTSLTAVDGDNMYIESDAAGVKSLMILTAGEQYILDPATMTGFKMAAQNELSSQKLFEEEAANYETTVSTGDIEIAGKTYTYEEFDIEGSLVKYCFDGDDMKYMLMTESGIEMTMEIVSMEKGADASLFKVPEGYTLVEL